MIIFRGRGKRDEIFEEDERCSIDLYDGEIVYVDQAIGQVRNALEQEKILEDTLIIVSADHGECLGQHGLKQNFIPKQNSYMYIGTL